MKTSAHGLAAFKHANEIGIIRKKKNIKPEINRKAFVMHLYKAIAFVT